MEKMRDTLFKERPGARDFAFDRSVVRVFDDMVARSVPFYGEIQHMQSNLVQHLLPAENGCVLDLGCSTGTTIDLILRHPDCGATTRAVGIDNSPAMLEKARAKLGVFVGEKRVQLVAGDLDGDIDLPAANVTVMNWTLQFVRPIRRESLLQRVFAALKPGGALFLSEKILVEESLLNRVYIDLYLRFKSNAGYTAEEIQRKRESLENVLVPYRIEENVELLRHCGFATVDTYFRWFNWAGFIALKPA